MKPIVGGDELFDVACGRHVSLLIDQVVQFCEEWFDGPR
jgi:hypothetical protein